MKKLLRLALVLVALGIFASIGLAQESREARIDPSLSAQPGMPSLSCCECLGKVTTLDLSTGQGSPIDPIWKVNGGPAYTTPPYPGWTTSLTPPAKWIQPVPSPTPSNNVAPGVYKYTVQFNIPKCTIPSNIRLDVKWAADNSGRVFLDNNPVAACTSNTCFQTGVAQPFSVTAGLTPGPHTLRFEVTNISGPSGLIVNAKLTRECQKYP